MTQVTEPILLDKTGARMARALEVIAAAKAPSAITRWDVLASIMESALETKTLVPGQIITDYWKDIAAGTTYAEYDWHVASGVRTFELENGHTFKGGIIQAHWASPFGVQFSHQRAFLKCPDGLAAGTYYFTIESSWGSNVQAGDIVCFKTTVAVPVGGRISGCYGAPDQAKSNWRIYTYSADGKTVLETITPTFTASGTNLGTMKSNTRNGNLNSCQEMAYGWNRWKTSALRQFLNSEAGKGAWWTAQDEWDIAPDQLATKAGYLSGFDPEFVSILKPVKVVTYTNTVQDGGEADVTYDRIWLPSLEEMYIAPQVSGEGDALEYWEQVNGSDTKWAQYSTYPRLIHYACENHASAQVVRLRSAYRGYAYNTWFAYSSGYVSYHNASNAYGFAPLAAIGKI